MGVRTKTIVTVVVIGVALGLVTLQVQNKALFKGQTTLDPDEKTTEETPDETTANVDLNLPDLTATLKVTPDENGTALNAEVTIQNSGKGPVKSEKPFKYSIYINDTEVFSNSDSYSEMAAGDSFSFSYPISKAIYNYPEKGEVKFVVDQDNVVEESEEGNNEVVEKY